MGFANDLGAAQGSYKAWDFWLDKVTWKFALIYWKESNKGILHVQFDGVDVGTIDGYAAAASVNNYSDITGISQAMAKVVRVKTIVNSKNASSSGYRFVMQSVALIRTGGTASTPSGTGTPGYTHELHVWMATKSNTSWATRTQGSAEFGGGYLSTDSTAQNNLFTYDLWRENRTYKVAVVHRKGTDQGIFNITGFAGTQTIDAYNGSATSNNYSEVTGIAGGSADVATVQVQMATKNASSSAYGGQMNSIKWISTGA